MQHAKDTTPHDVPFVDRRNRTVRHLEPVCLLDLNELYPAGNFAYANSSSPHRRG